MNSVSNNILGISQLHADRAKDLRIERANGGPSPSALKTEVKSLQGKTQPSKNEAEIKKLSEEFESIFLGLVLKSMRDSVQKSGLIDGGNAENIYRSMLDDEYAKQMAAQHHTGLADQIANFLSGQNELRGQKAYAGQGLPDDPKKATIGDMKLSALPSSTTPAPLPLIQQGPKIPKTP